jgi:hypothetical protein
LDSAPDPTTPSKHFGFIFWACIVVGILLGLMTAWAWSGGEWTGESQGYAVGCLLLPTLIAYLAAGRRKVRNPTNFGLWFCGISLLSFLLELSHHLRN